MLIQHVFLLGRLKAEGERVKSVGFLGHNDVDDETLQLYTIKAGSTGGGSCSAAITDKLSVFPVLCNSF